MALRQRTVQGTLVDGDGIPITTGVIRFALTDKLAYTDTHVVIDRPFTVTTDNTDGTFSLDLWCDEDSLKPINYTVTFPIANAGQPDDDHSAVISLAWEDGSAKDIGTLIAESTDPSSFLDPATAADFVDNRIDTIISALSPLTPGLFPIPSFPGVYTNASANGNNDLYTVPAGRKAVILDYIVTNPTGGNIDSYPRIKIAGTYYPVGTAMTENAGGKGHNYAMSSGRSSQPIVLNAGESFTINTNASDLVIWVNLIEFEASSALSRADIRTWVNGANTLLTVPTGKTVSFGMLSSNNSSNTPSVGWSGVCYRNASGGTRTLGSVNIVPSGGSPGSTNEFAGSNTVFDASGFVKFFHGNLNAGDFISLNSDSNAAGQFAWVNYVAV